MPNLRPELELLLEAVESERKPLARPAVDLLLLAYTIAKRWPDEFRAEFGESVIGQVQAALVAGETLGDADSARQLVLDSDGPDPVAQLVHRLSQELAPFVSAPTRGAPTDTAEPPGADEGTAATASEISQRISALVSVIEPDANVIGRAGVVDELLVLLGRRTPIVPLLVGAPGSGRTTVLSALASRLSDSTYEGPLAGFRVVRLMPEAAVTRDPANALRMVFEDLTAPAVLVIDDLEVVAGFGLPNCHLDVLRLLRSASHSADVRLLLSIDTNYASRIAVLDSELDGELEPIELPTLPPPALASIVQAAANSLALFHSVTVSSDAISAALTPPGNLDRATHPGLAIARLDGACTTASLRSDRTVSALDLRLSRSPEVAPPDSHVLLDRLRARVLGQDASLQRVANRLALTRAQLDLRPQRPDGVFLFVGPTGVGKTELARAIASELFADSERLIRLDMSEYAHDWALSRLIGPQPGYVGFTEPQAWLTTRIRQQPETVLLLDEIEKAHPSIWNAFLQVFDAGRLTDSRGAVADFARSVIVMTSNLGASAFHAPAIGFSNHHGDGSEEDQRVLEALQHTMLPELLNRIDEIVVFRPLDSNAILRIARKEIDAAIDRLIERGYQLEVGDDVVNYLAETGYDRSFGARHLQRNIERLLLQPLSALNSRHARAMMKDGTVTWTEA